MFFIAIIIGSFIKYIPRHLKETLAMRNILSDSQRTFICECLRLVSFYVDDYSCMYAYIYLQHGLPKFREFGVLCSPCCCLPTCR